MFGGFETMPFMPCGKEFANCSNDSDNLSRLSFVSTDTLVLCSSASVSTYLQINQIK